MDERSKRWSLAFGVGFACLVIGSGIGLFLERPGDDNRRTWAPKEEPPIAPYAILAKELGVSEDDAFRRCATTSGMLKTLSVDFSPEEICFEIMQGIDCQRRVAKNRAFNLDGFLELLVKKVADFNSRYDFRKAACEAITRGL